jgi:hypothetical protein
LEFVNSFLSGWVGNVKWSVHLQQAIGQLGTLQALFTCSKKQAGDEEGNTKGTRKCKRL